MRACRNAEHELVCCHVIYNGCPCPDQRACANANAFPNCSSNTYHALTLHINATGYRRTRAYVHAVFKCAIMVYAASRVQDAPKPHFDMRAHNCPRSDKATLAESAIVAHNGGWVNQTI
ncbi:MAG: hypothetical protein Rhims3KO_00020 [Hyphomicrobiales bacterium]